MSERSEAERMLALAERDLRSLGAVVDEPEFAEETFGFLAQQTVEKGLKAVLSSQGTRYPLTHDLKKLYDELSPVGTLAAYGDLVTLFPYAVLFRYSDEEDAEPFDREALLERLRQFATAVRNEIGL